MRHADIILNEWAAGKQRRIGWVTEEVEHAEWLPSGTYMFTTELHNDDECPFAGGDVVAMRMTKPT